MAKYITKEELKQSLRHYWRMRKWARHQNPYDMPNRDIMDQAIEETWDGCYCVLCKTYSNRLDHSCRPCPLLVNGFGCNDSGENNSIWLSMGYCNTWAEWIIAATNMAIVIMKLPREKS